MHRPIRFSWGCPPPKHWSCGISGGGAVSFLGGKIRVWYLPLAMTLGSFTIQKVLHFTTVWSPKCTSWVPCLPSNLVVLFVEESAAITSPPVLPNEPSGSRVHQSFRRRTHMWKTRQVISLGSFKQTSTHWRWWNYKPSKKQMHYIVTLIHLTLYLVYKFYKSFPTFSKNPPSTWASQVNNLLFPYSQQTNGIPKLAKKPASPHLPDPVDFFSLSFFQPGRAF